ncbi:MULTISPECIES: FtsX-like permease family protein [unclassified Streptomyces]|uniref:ABC transporter permease n=1 Tax=unclassified Streptomyces TaxID=2593676 RepID=UPI001EFDA10C|nr:MULTISPECIES: FtsX-like permease family protein [unclassified Streptomyces]
MFRIALRNMLAHKARLLMTMLAVVLGVAFVAGTLLFTATIGKGLKDSASRSFRDVSVAVRPTGRESGSTVSGQERTGVAQDVYERLAALPGVESARGTVTGFTGVADDHNDLIGNGFVNQGGNYAPGRNGEDARFRFTEGRGPRTADEVALDARTASKGGYSLGDRVRLSVDGPVLAKKLTGVFTTEDGMVAAGGSLTLFDTATAQGLFLKKDLYQQVELTAEAGTTQEQLRATVGRALRAGSELEAVTGRQLTDDQAAAIAAQTSDINKVLLAFAGIALFVGVFLIANTFSMLVAQRIRELALLRAVGATRRQVTRSVLIEAAALGGVSAVVGIALGLGVAAGLRPLLNSAGAGLPDNPLVITPGAIVISLLVGVGITVLSAFLPSRRAAKTPPMAAMRSVDTPQTQRSLIVRNVIGYLLAALGLLLIGRRWPRARTRRGPCSSLSARCSRCAASSC